MLKKIAFIGSVGSGKTTIINQLSQVDVLDTDVESSVNIGKDKTTVGMDYGYIVVDKSTQLGLYGVPGQRKFKLIWEYVKQGLWAIVVLVKNGQAESIDELDYLIEFFEINQNMPLIIGVTHADKYDAQQTIEVINNKLMKYRLNVPIFSIDPRQSESAMLIMNTLIALEETQ